MKLPHPPPTGKEILYSLLGFLVFVFIAVSAFGVRNDEFFKYLLIGIVATTVICGIYYIIERRTKNL